MKDVRRYKSRRTVVLSLARDALEQHRERMAAGGRDVQTRLVFPNTDGGSVCKVTCTRGISY